MADKKKKKMMREIIQKNPKDDEPCPEGSSSPPPHRKKDHMLERNRKHSIKKGKLNLVEENEDQNIPNGVVKNLRKKKKDVREKVREKEGDFVKKRADQEKKKKKKKDDRRCSQTRETTMKNTYSIEKEKLDKDNKEKKSKKAQKGNHYGGPEKHEMSVEEMNGNGEEPSYVHQNTLIGSGGSQLKQEKTKRKRGNEELREEEGHLRRKKRKKKNRKGETNGVEDPPVPEKKKSKKQVSFSNTVEVLSFEKARPSDGGCSESGDGLVMGKRYSTEEDDMIRKAISDYIEQHDLGENGLEKVLNCRKYPEVKSCWTEIAAQLPWRPRRSIYERAHVIYQRADERKWDDEEREAVRRYVAEHGRKWKKLGDELGKHRYHVKDLWRRTKLSTYTKGHWSQEEYQQLFNLINLDLQVKAFEEKKDFEEKKTKYGMLRDNIPWEAISDKLTTRNQTTCCLKWYNRLASPLVKAGSWANVDDYRLLGRLLELDACNMEDVEWDTLLDNRSGELCRKRWLQMTKHIGENRAKPFSEQVHLLASRYCPKLLQ